jgi:Zn-dependent peptidase ImmA (M78 family)
MEAVRCAIAEQRAEQLIASLGITDPREIDVKDIAMTKGALVIEGGLSGAEARLMSSPGISLIRVNSAIPERGRKRFGIGHEIGHLDLHRAGSPIEICTQNDLVLFHSAKQKEREANAFAATLLMPTRMFEPHCRSLTPSLRAISSLAQEFDVSLTAAGMRYIRFCPHRCCLVVSTNGRVRYHQRTEDFGHFLHPADELRGSTYAADLFAGNSIPKGMRSVPAAAWLEGSKIGPEKRILEDSIFMSNYNSTITLLWIDQDIDKRVTGDDEEDAEQERSDSRWSWNRYSRDRE